jgi:hypothetical protein
MISSDPHDRPFIDDVLCDNWFGEIREMSTEQLNDYEKEIKLEDEFKRRRDIINACTSLSYQKNDDGIHPIYNTRGIDDDEDMKEYFQVDVFPKSIEKGKYMNYFINIKGHIYPKKFLNQLCNKIVGKYCEEDGDCYISIKDAKKAKFDVEFEMPENKFVVPEQLKAEFEKLGINLNEKKEEKKEKNNNNLIIRFKLYKTSEGYLLRFVKKQGNKNDFIDKFEAISKLVESIIKEKKKEN